MSKHLYAVGAVVSLTPDGQFTSAAGRFIVEAQVPPLGTALQYRIKNEAEGFRRVVVEHRLNVVGGDHP